MRNPNCTKCGLHANVKSVCIPDDGDLGSRVVVLGTAPGADEDLLGKPFVGRSGQLLRAALGNVGIVPRIANVVRCRPPGNRDPDSSEVKSCREYLDSSFAENPNLEVVVPLGEIPCRALGLKGPVLKLAGVPVTVTILGKSYTAFPLAHPAYILRNPAYLSVWEAHIAGLKNLLTPRDNTVPLSASSELEPGLVSLDLETTGLDPERDSVLAYAVSDGQKVSCTHVTSPDHVRSLVSVFQDYPKIAVHGAFFEGAWAKKFLGVDPKNIVRDTMLLAHRVDPGQPADLGSVVQRHLPEFAGYKLESNEGIKDAASLPVTYSKDETLWTLLLQLSLCPFLNTNSLHALIQERLRRT